MGEKVDGLPRLAHCLFANPSRHQTAHRHVLPDEQTEFVGATVELGCRNVGVTAHQIEPRFPYRLEIGGNHSLVGVARPSRGRDHGDALDEDSGAVDRQLPVVKANRPESDSAIPTVVNFTVDHHLAREVMEWLIAKCVWPPEFRVCNVEGPLNPVLSGGCRVTELVVATGHLGP